MVVPYIVSGLMLLLVGAAVVRLAGFLLSIRTRWEEVKESLVRNEAEHVCLLAGEVSPDFYRRISEIVRNRPGMRMEVCAGPWMLVDDDCYEGNFDSVTEKIKDPSSIWKLHPLFELAHDFPDRVQIYIKERALPEERHFGIGLTSRQVFVEHHHGKSKFRGGVFFEAHSEVYETKLADFVAIRDNRKLCTLLTKENVHQVLNRQGVRFCAVSRRPAAA